ncbi:MAG: tyrosine-protein phosphatase [Trueperella sp.]|nr:tyrosine-protein phosphatase [Trueperella sp.]
MTIYNLRRVDVPLERGSLAPKLFRSSAPFAGGNNTQVLQDLGIRGILDLREDRERTATVSWDPDFEVIHVPVFNNELAHLYWENLTDLYRYMVTDYAHQLTTALAAIAELANDGGVLIHCTAGKDRTGVVVAILLSLLGAAQEDITLDYLASSTHLGSDYLASLAAAHGIVDMPGIVAHRATITDTDALNEVRKAIQTAGGVVPYLLHNGLHPDIPSRLGKQFIVEEIA